MISDVYKYSARDALVVGVILLFASLLLLTGIIVLPMLVVRADEETWKWVVAGLFCLFITLGGSTWFFVDYFQAKKNQRRMEEIEAAEKKERQRQSAAANQK